MKRRVWLGACSLLLASASAQSPAPAPATATRALAPFDAIDISGSATVRFTQGASEQIAVEGDDAALRALDVEVSGGVLQIRSAGSWKFWSAQPAPLVTTARQLKRLSISGAGRFHATSTVKVEQLSVAISGSGSVRFDDVQADTLRFAVSGAGDGALAGRARELSVSISGKGSVDSRQLESERARVAVSGIGNAQVWASRELDVSVAGVGTVEYWGSPQLRRSVSGSADIQHRGEKSAPR
jgi:hypothetical protein